MQVWLDLKRGAERSSLSVRTLRRYIGDSIHPLPVRLVGGKWLIHKDELDQWLQRFPRAGEDIDRLVDEAIKGFKRD